MSKVKIELTPDEVRLALAEYVSQLPFVRTLGGDAVGVASVELNVENYRDDRSSDSYAKFTGATITVTC